MAEASSTIADSGGSSETTTEEGSCQSESNAETESASVLPPDVLMPSNNTASTTASASAWMGSQESVCGSPMHAATKLCLVPFQPNGLRPISAIVTPPESPEKASTITTNAWLGSSVIGGSIRPESDPKPKPASKPEEVKKKHYSSDDCDLTQNWVRSFSYMRRQTELALVNTRRSHSYDGNYVPAKRVHTRDSSAPPVNLQAVKLSAALPECQHPSMRLPTQVNPRPERRSLLFDGDCDFEGIADGISGSMASVVSPMHYAPGRIDTPGNGYVGEGCSDTDDIDGDIPLADILEHSQATMVSPPALMDVINTAGVKKTKEHADKENRTTQSPVVSDKSRWYTSALAKAAQLDGFRHLGFRLKASATPKTRSNRHNPVNGSDNRIERRRRGRSNSNSNSNRNRNVGSPAPTAAAAVSAIANTTISAAEMHDIFAQQQRRKTFRFNEAVAVYETWDRDAYDRKGMPLTRLDADQLETIKEELNAFKMNEMYVHEDSRANTHIIC
ncbi:hypothetical protein GGI22_003167 [Coemansia erecta]|nr:hypothetical protein GGI22_003167 [Coemansia erecta]